MTLTAELCERYRVSDWRQHAYNVRHLKRLMRAAQNKKREPKPNPKREPLNAKSRLKKPITPICRWRSIIWTKRAPP